MAQLDEKRRISEKEISKTSNNNSNSNSNNNSDTTSEGGFKFNAHAAEFVPRSYTTISNGGNTNTNQLSLSTGYFYPCVQYLQDIHGDTHPHHHLLMSSGSGTPDWFCLNQPPTSPPPPPSYPTTPSSPPPPSLNNAHPHISNSGSPRYSVTDDLQQKIIKQVEYLFSDLSLMANDTMAKHVNKDPEGYVPISIIASMKKIKALVNDHHSLVQPLRSSTKLVVSKDNKKVKRRSPFTENYKDELQCRTVMVENLPDDHSYQNLDKIFRVVGSVKAIRLCHPPEANNNNPSRSKNEVIISNKLHALVEYENAETAERAAEKLNDERNWRKGMRVRVMLRRSPKSVLKNKKSDFDMLTDDDELPYADSPKANASFQSNAAEFVTDIINNNNNNNNDNGAQAQTQTQGGEESSRKASGVGVAGVGIGGRGRIKTKGLRIQNDRAGLGLLSSPTHCHSIGGGGSPSHTQCSDFKQRGFGVGPRMPDGTRGFTMGRGKPLVSSSSGSTTPTNSTSSTITSPRLHS